MADHDELVAEMPVLETMGTQDRQKLAKKRRLQQLKRWSQREKEWIAKEKQLNKRLANIMSEENNGLNLKHYTSYNSNQRTKKRHANKNTNNDNTEHETTINTASLTNGVNKKEFNNNCTIDGPYFNSLQPHGRVHFNIGVMLLEAAARDDYEEVKRFLSLGVSPDSVNHDGLTALHQCCIDASEPIMRLLLDFGANVDARDTEHWTPLHAACTCGHLNLVKILVEHNADLLAVNGDGNMPFDICEDEATLDYIESQMVKQGITQEMIDLTRATNEMLMLNNLEKLVSEGADLNEADDQGVTRLHIAATNNYLSAVKFMLNHGVNVNVCDNDLWQPLHGLACWGNEQHIKIAELLVEAGANLNAKTLNDETVFDLCDNVELLERLNQLKDELERKQATGTGRLKRTQSRTNSRVHSVRRTSVRDKNQISRREAREEAMLRVDSSKEATLSIDAPNTTVHPKQTNGNQSSVDNKERFDGDNSTQPKITNLDETDGVVKSNHDEFEDAQTNSSSQAVETVPDNDPSSFQYAPSDESLASDVKSEQYQQVTGIPGSYIAGDKPHTEKTFSPPPAIVKVNLPHQQKPPQPQSNGVSSQPRVCDSEEVGATASATATIRVEQQQQRQPPTSTVQVQYVPVNYTLSNLKKHRSDLRMRTCSLGGSGGSNPNNADGHQAQISLDANSFVIASPEAVRSDIEPALTTSNFSVRLNGNQDGNQDGILHRPESPGATFRKFHGEPSEILGGDINRKSRHKCCRII